MCAVKRIVRYLGGTVAFGLWFPQESNGVLEGFTDSDWGSSKNDRKSTSGMAFLLGASAIVWGSKKQDIVALSTTEAEYIAATTAACQAVWLKRLLSDLEIVVYNPVTIWCDNQSAISIAKHPTLHGRTKHIDIRYHFIRGLIADGVITLQHCDTLNQVADIFTKALPVEKHEKFRAMLGVTKLESKEGMSGCD